MAEAVKPPEETGQEATGGGGQANDGLVIHPFLHAYPLKTSAQKKGQLKKQLDRLIVKGDKALEKEAAAFTTDLEGARTALNTALESASVSSEAVLDAAAAYLSLLTGLLSGSSSSDSATAGDSPDAALALAEQGSSASGAPLSGPPSRLRAAAQFQWNDVLVAPPAGSQPRSASAADAMFELASALVATALRLMHAAAAACLDSATGVATPATTRGYQLLRQAAGMLDFVAGQVLPALPAGAASMDLDAGLVRALSSLALADAQQLTVLRAVAKGNQPALIAGLAADTAALYAQAGGQLSSSQSAEVRGCKLWHYAAYKQRYMEAYAHAFNGIALWKGQDKCGAGLKSLDAASAAAGAAKKASSGYDAAAPASLNLNHRRVDEDLDHVIWDTQRRMKRENDTVYLQAVPAEVPPLAQGKRLVAPLAYALPQPAAAVRGSVVERCFAAGPAPAPAPTAAPAQAAMSSGAAAAAGGGDGATPAAAGGEKGSDAKEEQGCSCCRLITVIICFPILAVLWLLGAVIWIILLPLKCCLPCCGFPLQWAADLVLWLMKAPARALLWATGDKDEKEDGGKEGKQTK